MVGMDMRFWVCRISCTVILNACEEYMYCLFNDHSQNCISLNFQREKLPPMQIRGRYYGVFRARIVLLMGRRPVSRLFDACIKCCAYIFQLK